MYIYIYIERERDNLSVIFMPYMILVYIFNIGRVKAYV